MAFSGLRGLDLSASGHLETLLATRLCLHFRHFRLLVRFGVRAQLGMPLWPAAHFKGTRYTAWNGMASKKAGFDVLIAHRTALSKIHHRRFWPIISS